MIDKINKFANIFSTAAILAPGESTTSLQEAVQIAPIAKAAFDHIQKELLEQWPHDMFEIVINKLMNNEMPQGQELAGAAKEFESLKSFSSFSNIIDDVRRMLRVEYV